MGDAGRKTELFEQIARMAKALANGKRLELLDLLAQGERTVDALSQASGMGMTTTSANLQNLKAGGIVATRRDGTKIYYRLAGPDVAELYARLRDAAAAHLTDVAAARDAYLGGQDAGEPVDRVELLRRATAGEVVVLDVRPDVEFAAGHIPGAVNIPVDDLADRLDELPDGVEIVAYCRGAFCVMAHDAVRLLTARGRLARRLADGLLEWRLNDLPVTAAAGPSGTR